MTSDTPHPGDGAGRVDGRASRWEEHRRQRRVELVDHTIRAIRQHGAGVGLDDIAAQAGTSKTVIYRHFEDRTGLYRAVAQRVEGQIVGRVRSSLDADASPREVLESVIDAYLRLVERDPELYRFVIRRPLVDGPLDDDPVPGITSQVAATVAAILDEATTPAVSHVWAVALVGSVQACADDWLAADPATRLTRAELTHQLAELAWHGVAQTYRRPV